MHVPAHSEAKSACLKGVELTPSSAFSSIFSGFLECAVWLALWPQVVHVLYGFVGFWFNAHSKTIPVSAREGERGR